MKINETLLTVFLDVRSIMFYMIILHKHPYSSHLKSYNFINYVNHTNQRLNKMIWYKMTI